MSFVVGEQVGAYRIVEQLGQGGMSTVYKAYHAALDRYVALKVLHPMFKGDRSFLERFQREARIVARLEHPHIVPVYDFSEHEGVPYLVMRYVEGRTLKALMNEEGAVPLGRIVEILRPVCDALAYAHALGVLHRDIKPSNVLLSQQGKVFVTDYGLAKMVQTGDSTISQDRMIGTPQYISPEQAKGETVDARTDLYSLGVVLFELVTGRVPYMADTPFAIVHDHIFSPLPLPSQVDPTVPQEIEQVILKSLAKSAEDRYQSADEFFGALEAAAQSLGVQPALLSPRRPAAPDVVPPSSSSTEEAGVEGLRPSTVTFPVAGAAAEEPADVPARPGVTAETPAAQPSPLAELASAVGEAVSAGVAEAKPDLDKARSEIAAGMSEMQEKVGASLSEAARSIRASLPTESAPSSSAQSPTPEPAVPSAPPVPAAVPQKQGGRWYVYIGIGVAVVVVALLALIVFRQVRGRALVRAATATAQAAAQQPTPPSGPPPPIEEIPVDPFPIWVGDGYAPPGSIPFAEGEARLGELDGLLKEDPGNPELHLERGDILFSLERFEEAEGAYRQVLDLDPDMFWAHYNLGVTLLFLQRSEEALGEFQWMMDVTGGQVEAPILFNLGLAHALADHRPEAVDALREFLRRYPDEDDHRRQALELLRRVQDQ